MELRATEVESSEPPASFPETKKKSKALTCDHKFLHLWNEHFRHLVFRAEAGGAMTRTGKRWLGDSGGPLKFSWALAKIPKDIILPYCQVPNAPKE